MGSLQVPVKKNRAVTESFYKTPLLNLEFGSRDRPGTHNSNQRAANQGREFQIRGFASTGVRSHNGASDGEDRDPQGPTPAPPGRLARSMRPFSRISWPPAPSPVHGQGSWECMSRLGLLRTSRAVVFRKRAHAPTLFSSSLTGCRPCVSVSHFAPPDKVHGVT